MSLRSRDRENSRRAASVTFELRIVCVCVCVYVVSISDRVALRRKAIVWLHEFRRLGGRPDRTLV